MKLVASGSLQLDDFRAKFPYQRQPPASLPQFLVNSSAANSQAINNLIVDPLAGCVYAANLFVPHNQKLATVTGGPVVDNGKWIKAGLPSFTWDSVTLGGATIGVQCFQRRNWGYQYPDVIWSADTNPAAATLDAVANLDTGTDSQAPTNGNVPPQGLQVLLTRTIYHVLDPASAGSWEIQWVANLRRYSLLVQSHRRPLVRRSEDDGATWTVVKNDQQVGGSAHTVMGNAVPDSAQEIAVQILLMNQAMRVTVAGETTPYLIPVVDAAPDSAPSLAQGAGSLAAGTYQVGYTYVTQDGDESALSPVGAVTIAATHGVTVPAVPPPSGNCTVNWYLSTPLGMQLAGSGSGGFTIASLPDATAAHPPAFSKVKPTIREVRIKASYFSQFGFAVHPMKWVTNPTLDSNPIGLGFGPDVSTPPYYVIHGLTGAKTVHSGVNWPVSFPAGASMSVTTLGDPTDPDQQFQLALNNPAATADGAPNGQAATYGGQAYSHLTVAATRVTLKVDGILQAPAASVARSIVPREIVMRTVFDVKDLTIRRTLEVVCNNFHGQWAGTAGNVAISLALGMAAPNIPNVQQFTGFVDTWTYTRPDPARALVAMGCCDQMEQLAQFQFASPPDMDGWNHYFAQRFVANAAGIPDSRIGFLGLVPSDPYTSAPGDPEPYFLPFGTGMNPWTPRNRTMPALDLANYLRQPTGFLLYFDQNAVLQYQKWIPPSPAAVTKTFLEQETVAANLQQYSNLRVRTSTKNVRNEVYLIGIDPYADTWQPILLSRRDAASVDSPAGSRPDNFKGFRAPFIWSGALFASSDFSSRAIDRLYLLNRLPEYSCSFDCWPQPQLQVMQVINVYDPKSGAQTVPFYVIGLTHRWSIHESGRQTFRSSIEGAFLV